MCIVSTSTVTVEQGWSFITGPAAVDLAVECAADLVVRTIEIGMGDDGQSRALVTVDAT